MNFQDYKVVKINNPKNAINVVKRFISASISVRFLLSSIFFVVPLFIMGFFYMISIKAA